MGMDENVGGDYTERPTGFIGSMKGTMEIVGDIVAPIDVRWEADGETSPLLDPTGGFGRDLARRDEHC